ncbi:MAG: hypothetical protein K9N07_11790, partial [Candidatus Cloacimonetes bacterium]|nr:hypothetical protein [Candidatus Cloacimonadota bacterium]
NKDNLKEISITLPKENKMVRTSFNISGLAVGAIKSLTISYGLTVNKIFELFLNDKILVEYAAKDESKIFNYFAEKQDKITKAYAVSEKTRDSLNKIAKKFGIKRDSLVERSLIAFKELLTMKTNDKIEKLKQVLQLAEELNSQAAKTHDEIAELIGFDDDQKIMHAIGAVWSYSDDVVSETETSIQEYEKMLDNEGIL